MQIVIVVVHALFLSTLSLRRATPSFCELPSKAGISIHALLAESDAPNRHPYHCNRNFYPRSPCGERHKRQMRGEFSDVISIHALLAESDHFDTLSALAPKQFLSTLSLRRATGRHPKYQHQQKNFYPRSPCGERHAGRGHVAGGQQISIHALLAESDRQLPWRH